MSVLTKALGHSVKIQLCSLLLTPWFSNRPDRTYRRARIIRTVLGQRAMFAVSSHLAAIAMCGGAPERGTIVLVNRDNSEVTEVDTDQAPPAVRAMLRLTMAVGHRDYDTAWAVWLSVPKDQRMGLTMALVQVAAEHLKSHMDSDVSPDVPDDARDLTEGTS